MPATPEPKAWIPGEADFANAEYLSRPDWWLTRTPAEARRNPEARGPVTPRGPGNSPVADFLMPAAYTIR